MGACPEKMEDESNGQHGKTRDKEEEQDGDLAQQVYVDGLEVNQENEDTAAGASHFDDRTGAELDPELVAAAEKEELDFMERIGVGEESSLEECWRNTGKLPVTTKFVRVNKGTGDNPDARAAVWQGL